MEYIEVRIKEIIQETMTHGCHRVVIDDLDSTFRIPIFMSSADAMPLLGLLQGENSLRPRPHDLLLNFIDMANYDIRNVKITGFEKGIYRCEIVIINTENTINLEARTCDGFFIALRRKIPILLNRSVGERVAGIKRFRHLTPNEKLRELEHKLELLVKNEYYEEAAILRDRINKIKS
ncbi:MAG: bifunctional nuclease family protein [Rikenellaceae bacterium]|nr:bifunctional nuclease family protein [Rikenellaceae bacterium]